jgi:transposase
MEVVYECCCGLDVHAKTVVACLVTKGRKESRTFATMTDELLQLGDWLSSGGCTHVAIESTGVYWKPVFNILESLLTVSLVNAWHIKAVPGRKTDVRDCEWLADLLRHGLLKASFIPPPEIRELRELIRYRQTLVTEHTAVANRITKLIESANIKLGQVAREVLGLSGRLMLRALAAGETNAEKLTELAQGKLKSQKAELRRALAGCLTPVQRWVLTELLTRVEELEAAQARAETRISEEVATCADPFVPQAVELLESIPGIGQWTAQTIVAEIGVDMSRFPSAKYLASWAGVCPGNHESAGKRKGGQPPKGNKSVRTILVEAAWAATHAKGTFLQAKYQRLVKRMPKQKALGTIAHRLLVISYHLLSRRVLYAELGTAPLDQQQVTRQRRRLVEQLIGLGVKVTIDEGEAIA